MTFGSIIGINLAVIMVFMLAVWLLSVQLRDSSIVDPCWGTGFVLLAWVTWLRMESVTTVATLLLVLTTIWGARLSLFLLWRNHGPRREGPHQEDRRYRAMRDKHGERFWWVSLFTVFWLQAVLLWMISMVIQAGMFYSKPETVWLWVVAGVLVWLTGFLFESVGDWQLAAFKSDPGNKGKVLNTGLWRYTRHPNYFGDSCIWWGLFLVAISSGVWWTIYSPLLMTFFLLKVSGVAMLERDIAERRPGYREYIRQTSSFLPWPPRR